MLTYLSLLWSFMCHLPILSLSCPYVSDKIFARMIIFFNLPIKENKNTHTHTAKQKRKSHVIHSSSLVHLQLTNLYPLLIHTLQSFAKNLHIRRRQFTQIQRRKHHAAVIAGMTQTHRLPLRIYPTWPWSCLNVTFMWTWIYIVHRNLNCLGLSHFEAMCISGTL